MKISRSVIDLVSMNVLKNKNKEVKRKNILENSLGSSSLCAPNPEVAPGTESQ